MGQTLSATCGSGTRQYFHAASAGEISVLKELLLVRPDLLENTTSGGQSIVHLAAGKGDVEVLRAIVDVFAGLAEVQSSEGSEYDFKVHTMRNLDSSRQLRAAFNLQTNSGQTPLMLAAKSGHANAVRFLVDKGAEVFKTDKSHERSVLHYAVANGQDQVLKYLVSDSTLMHSDEGVQPLRSIQVKDISGQCRFIDSRAENGLTALHIAAVKGDLKSVKLLLDAGASMMVRTVDMDMPSSHSVPNGSTPLHLAAQKGSVAIVQAMLQAHADALGNWSGNGSTQADGRRGWEQSTRIDLRSVANALRQLPYHVAWQRGFRQTAQILNPTVPVDLALENVRELDEGFGPQKLSTLAAYCLRKNLLEWLDHHKVRLEEEKADREKRATAKRVIAQQKRKEALKFHSQDSVDDSIAKEDSRMVSINDTGHTFASSQELPPKKLRASKSRSKRRDEGQDVLSTIHSMAGFDGSRSLSVGSNVNVPEDPQEVQPTPSSRPTGKENDSVSSDQTEPSKTGGRLSALKSASRLRSSMKKLRPSRPPPPPPPESSSSQSSATVAIPRHRRNVSWENSQQDNTAQNGSPPVVMNCLGSPFRSPFAQASTEEGQNESEEEVERPRPANPMVSHPSGVELMDPPSSGSFVQPRLLSSKSRKGSFSLGALGSSSALKSKKSRRMSQDFGRAASIPGFDNNMDSDEDCGICLEEPVNVTVSDCKHKLCVDCAIKLCQVAKKPPLCPYCRVTINAFTQCTQ